MSANKHKPALKSEMNIEEWNLFRMALLQRHLHECLTYFLHVSQAGNHRPYLSTGNKLYSGNLSILDGICSRLMGESVAAKKKFATHIHPLQYAEILSRAYRLWKTGSIAADSHPRTLPKGKSYEEWFRTGGGMEKYWPVHELRKWLLKYGANYFRHSLLHGSVGTLDDKNGFSDLDLALIIKENILVNKKALVELRQRARQILIFTYAFDPLMHHGPYYLTELDLPLYPQGLLPLVVYENGVCLHEGDEPIYVKPYNSEYFTDSLISGFADNYKQWANVNQCIVDPWDVELILGITMILPALCLQRINHIFRYKRDTFAVAKMAFTEEQWRPIEIASEIRSSLPARYRPSRVLVNIAGLSRNPGMLVKKALYHPKSKQALEFARYKAGKDFAKQASVLIQSMQAKITNIDAEKRNRSEDFLCALGNIQTGPFTDEPFKATSADYITAEDYLVDRWTKPNKRPIAIYKLGSVGAVGHSDLDFVLVWPDGQPICYKNYQQIEYPKSIQPYIVHPPYFCTPKLWKKLAGWYPAFRLQHLWGEQLDLHEVPDSAYKGIALGHLAASLHTKLPEDLFLFALQKPLRLRVIINTLHSFKYTCQLSAMAGITLPLEITGLATRIEQLRENWIESIPKPFDELQQLCVAVCHALQIIHDWCIEAVDISCKTRENTDEPPIHLLNLSAYARHASSYYYKTGLTPRLLTPGLARFLSLCTVFEPQMLRSFIKLGKLPKVSIKESIYTEGLKLFAATSVEYADIMIPLGIPATKYYSLGYSPKQSSINKSDSLLALPRLGRLIKRALSKTRETRSLCWIADFINSSNIIHKLKARVNYFKKFCYLYPRIRLFKLLNPNKQVIIISQLMHMGDIVACEPVARQLREKSPGAYIIWCVDIRYKELVESNPHIQHVFSVQCMWEWSRLHESDLFDSVIDLNVHERRCSRCNIQLYKHGAARAIRGGTQYRYNSLQEAFTKGAGFEIIPDGPMVYCSKNIIRKIDSLSLPSFFISIHCKSNEECRDIPRGKWIEIVHYLCDTLHVNVVEVGSMAFASIESPRYFDYCKKLSILETAEVIRRSALFIGIDSGPAHLANAVRTPGILLMGQYLAYTRYMPYTGFYTDPRNADLLWADGPAAILAVSTIIKALNECLQNKITGANLI